MIKFWSLLWVAEWLDTTSSKQDIFLDLQNRSTKYVVGLAEGLTHKAVSTYVFH